MKRPLKTARMLLLEAKDPQTRDIQQIMIDAYEETGSQRAAAEKLGITAAAFNQWTFRLSLNLRQERVAS